MLSAFVDCARACSLDPTYIKAYTRAAAICESVQLYPEALEFLSEISANRKLSKKENRAISQKVRHLEDILAKAKELQGYYGCYEEACGPLPNYYKIFSLDMSAESTDVKKRYHRVALKCHPDKDALCGHVPMDKMNMVFGVIRQAYDVLSNDERRREYDKQLLDQVQGRYRGHGHGGHSFTNNWRKQNSHNHHHHHHGGRRGKKNNSSSSSRGGGGGGYYAY
mmetsp:Transcript_14357/g.40828  ORF Transcript_14357/g.40828 Transcript_14357/m.40828 type:complete len:223 (+) Transcript_14357:622-1290(+)